VVLEVDGVLIGVRSRSGRRRFSIAGPPTCRATALVVARYAVQNRRCPEPRDCNKHRLLTLFRSVLTWRPASIPVPLRVMQCAVCGEENPARARFCLACGSPLLEAPASPAEERKVVSVLFVDLVGHTARSDQADPEDVRARLRPYHARVKQEISASAARSRSSSATQSWRSSARRSHTKTMPSGRSGPVFAFSRRCRTSRSTSVSP
jgi:hypothetical protein